MNDHSAGKPRFVVGVNVGRLAKWLRAMGYDTLYVPDADDAELLRVASAQGRILVTKDRRILERRAVARGDARVALVTCDDFREQLYFLVKTLGLAFKDGFSLCIECNASLREQPRERVRERVPPYVYQTQDSFFECPSCGKLYWRGTHWRNMRAELAALSEGT